MPAARAVVLTGKGGPEVLALADRQVRDPGPGEVLVEVAAAAVNRADVLQRRGFYPAPPGSPPDIPGLEYAGTVAAVGDGVALAKPGDRVMGIVGGGAMCTHVVVHERELIPVPDGVELQQAAGIPEVFLTAFDALFLQGGLTMGRTALVHAIGSGVGTAALQLGIASGARVIGTSRTASKLERCRSLGLEHGILVEGGAFADEVAAIAGGADVILDTIGAAYLEENVRAVAKRGCIVVVGLLGGATGSLLLGPLLAKRVSVVGTVLRARPLEEKAALARRFAAEVVPLFEAGTLVPVIDRVMPMGEIADAHAYMESNDSFGKIVVAW